MLRIYLSFILLMLTLYSVGYIALGDSGYSKIFLFDLDGDGVPEVVTNVGIVSGNALQAFPRPMDVTRFNCDPSTRCLLLVDKAVNLGYVYATGRIVAEIPVDGVISVSNNPYLILTIGSRVYWSGYWVKPSLDPIDLKAFIYDGRLTLAYVDNTTKYVVLESPGVFLRRIVPFEGRLLGVGSTGRIVHILVGSTTSTTFIEWDPSGLLKIKVYNFMVNDVVAYSNGAFIANGEEGVYIVRGDTANLILKGYRVTKVGFDGELLVVGLGRVLIAEVYGDGLRVLSEHSLGEVVDVDYGYGVLVYTDGFKVNTLTVTRKPRVELSIPSNVIAGEPVDVAILGDFVKAIVRLPDVGVIVLDRGNPRITWRPVTPGVHVVTALVDTGESTVVLSKEVVIAPRPATLMIRVGSTSVKPYSNVTVVLEVVDGLRGLPLRDILGNCSITTLVGSYPARPWTPVVIPTKPRGLEVPISAYCRLPSPYLEARATVTLSVSESYVEVQPVYLGGGVLRFLAYNKYTGEPVEGELRVTVGGNTTIVRVGGEFRLPKPGLWEVRWELLSDGVVLARGSQLITWYGDITQAPPGAPLLVADRFITVTETKVESREVPVSVPIEVRRPDPIVSLLSFIAGIALAGVPLVVLLLRRAGE